MNERCESRSVSTEFQNLAEVVGGRAAMIIFEQILA
jgi:hypothetical protein